jgi:hypothetical protein
MMALPFSSGNEFTGFSSCSRIACGSCCIEAPMITSGSPLWMLTMIESLAPMPMSAAPPIIFCGTVGPGPPTRISTSSPASR